MAHKTIEVPVDLTVGAVQQLASDEHRHIHPWFEWIEQQMEKTTPYKLSSIFRRARWGGPEALLGQHRRGPPRDKE